MAATPNQQQAINAREGNYLVSASAGSGKTYVLTERVFQTILEGTKLSELLILTFTNLAAAEMRDRIRQKLIELGANVNSTNQFVINFKKGVLFCLMKLHYI